MPRSGRVKAATRALIESLLPSSARRRSMELLLKSPLPILLARILPPYVRLEGCEFLVAEGRIENPQHYFQLLTGTHESAERKLALEWFQNDAPLVDLGAGLGTVSVCAVLARGIPYLVACEPDSALFSLLRRNMAINRVDGVTVCKGIWYGDESPRLDNAASDWTSQRLVASFSENATSPEIIPTTLKEIVDEYLPPDQPFQLLADIEGLEWQLFAHEKSLLEERCLRIVVELHWDPEYLPPGIGAKTADELLSLADTFLEPIGLHRVAHLSVVACYVRDE